MHSIFFSALKKETILRLPLIGEIVMPISNKVQTYDPVDQRSQTRGPPEVLVWPSTSFINRKYCRFVIILAHFFALFSFFLISQSISVQNKPFLSNLAYLYTLGSTMRPAEPFSF